MAFSVVLAAAGSGKRFGGQVKKQFLPLAGKVLFRHSLETFLNSQQVHKIVVTIHPEDRERFDEELKSLDVSQRVRIVPGDDERYLSVRQGLAALKDFIGDRHPSGKEEEWVLIHDAARPLISPRDLEGIVSLARGSGEGVLPCFPVKDTIKQVRDGRVISSLIRDELAAAATPQCFKLETLLRAYQNLSGENIPTDDAEIYFTTRQAIRVYWLKDPNPKLTTAEDQPLIESLLKTRQQTV